MPVIYPKLLNEQIYQQKIILHGYEYLRLKNFIKFIIISILTLQRGKVCEFVRRLICRKIKLSAFQVQAVFIKTSTNR